MRLPLEMFCEMDSLSACAKALSTVRSISEFMVLVLMFSFSNMTVTPNCFSIPHILDAVHSVAGKAGD